MTTTLPDTKLVDAEGLLAALFDPDSRPSLRWLRDQQKRRAVPFVRCGRLIRFDPVQVRAALDSRYTVQARKEMSGVQIA